MTISPCPPGDREFPPENEATAVHRSHDDLLSELQAGFANPPRRRLHVHPDAVMWIAISVQNTGLSPHVCVVPDPDCPEVGKGWVEVFTGEQWAGMLALVGRRVAVRTATLGALTGTLLKLDNTEARLDLGDGDVRYLPWISIELSESEAVQ